MHARDVEVGEVGAVGFVHVVVAFEEGGAGGGYDGAEEEGGVVGAGFGVREEASQDADLEGGLVGGFGFGERRGEC